MLIMLRLWQYKKKYKIILCDIIATMCDIFTVYNSSNVMCEVLKSSYSNSQIAKFFLTSKQTTTMLTYLYIYTS
ncbi:hypothetical protein [uncultured Mediterranean phage uvMED]|nr:hypothetical protein [uncultured Mediterranean phage uvMED]